MKLVKFLITISLMFAVAAIGAVFVADNPEVVNVSFYRWQLHQISLPLFSIAVFSIGLLVGAFATAIRVISLQSRLALVQRQLNSVEKERDKLKLSGSDK